MIGSKWLGVLAAASLLTACSSAETTAPTENVGKSEEAITGGCGFGTQNLGLPCDPDGAGGPLQECDGVCALRTGGIGGGFTSECVALKTGESNDGKICGSNGASDCSKHCVGKLCVGTPAPKGAACLPSGSPFGSDICDGQCNGAGACEAISGTKCSTGNATCGYNFCSASSATTCVKLPYAKGTTCNDGTACTTGDACDGAGKCTGTPKTCPASGTPCLVNACDTTSTTGACIAKPQPGVACTLTGDKCFAGVCDSSGACVKGTAISCDDGDACTIDACDATTGCTHTAKTCPPPSDACTVATCDKTSGACGFTTKSCDDGNPCTTDSCSSSGGCVHTPISGCSFDAGPADTGAPTDTGTAPSDTGTAPTDTGTAPTDTGVAPTDSGTTPVDTGTTEEDTGTVEDDTGTMPSDSGATDGGDDGGSGLEETVEAGGCGCRTTGSSTSSSSIALALGALALVAARRRRR